MSPWCSLTLPAWKITPSRKRRRKPRHRSIAMHVTLRRYKIAPGATAELKRQIQEGFVPIVSQLPGFLEYFWTSAGENEMFSISVFKDRAGAEQSVRAAA